LLLNPNLIERRRWPANYVSVAGIIEIMTEAMVKNASMVDATTMTAKSGATPAETRQRLAITSSNLATHLQQVNKLPMLTAEDEYMLAKQYRKNGDAEAAHRLVASHLRLVAKIAMRYRGYGFPIAELISEGNFGMMRAIQHFDPYHGVRLSTYAAWWIRASIQEYVMHSWSMVKIGTTASQKKLFFNLGRLKARLGSDRHGGLSPEMARQISVELSVPESAVLDMDNRLSVADHSLNAPLGSDGSAEWQDTLVDHRENQEVSFETRQEFEVRQTMLKAAMTRLADRERNILMERRLKERPATLGDLSRKYGISSERVRQIEKGAIEKLRKWVAGRSLTPAPVG
jgi:RNA polymerase sigma-32 factor